MVHRNQFYLYRGFGLVCAVFVTLQKYLTAASNSLIMHHAFFPSEFEMVGSFIQIDLIGYFQALFLKNMFT